MFVGDLIEQLEGWDRGMEVVIRVAEPEDEEGGIVITSADEVFGEYCEITDERNILVENGKVVIIGDLMAE